MLLKRPRSPYWYFKFTLNGVTYERSTRVTSKRQAAEIEARVRHDTIMRSHMPERYKHQVEAITVFQMGKLWEEHAAEKASLNRDLFRWGKFADYVGRPVPITEITREHVDGWIRSLLKTDLAPKTIKHYRDAVRAILNLAVERDYIMKNPATGSKIPRQPEARDREITEQEFDAILNHSSCENVTWALVLAWYCGLRLQEAVWLQWEDIDLKARTIKIRSEHTKTKARRIVPIPAEFLEMLDGWPEDERTGLLTEVRKDTVTQAWTRACAALGIKNARFHDLRHSYATRLRRAGVNFVVIMKIMGHTNMETAKRYQEFTPEDLVEAVA